MRRPRALRLSTHFASFLLLGSISLVGTILQPAVAMACGGGFTEVDGVVEVGDQLAFYSVMDDGRTEVVVHLLVPDARSDFGVILPVAGEPTLDASAVEASELAALESATAPLLVTEDTSGFSSGDSGCGCGDGDETGGGDFNGGGGGSGVEQLDQVDIGPITAVSIAADDPDALNAWLDDNGFAIDEAQQSILEAYVAEGRNFIAFKRNEAIRSGASAVGVHFTLPADYRSYPLRMASVGAAEQLGVRVYVARPGGQGAGPTAPFETLTLDDLNKDTIRDVGYSVAVEDAVRERGGKAFLVEGIFGPETGWRDGLSPRLQAMTAPQGTLTRISAVIPRATLDTDVDFTAPVETAPNQLDLDTASLGRPRSVPVRWGSVGLFLGAVVATVVRRSRRWASPPPKA